MKFTRFFCAVLLLVVILLPGTVSAVSKQSAASNITVFMDGDQVEFGVQPVLEQGTTLVPMRAIFEKLGASITEWNNQTKTVSAQKNQREIIYTIGETKASLNGGTYRFSSVPGKIVNGSVLVPLRFISESLGATVGYDSKARRVSIQNNQHIWGSQTPAQTFGGYRLTMPYQRMLQAAPYFISYIRQHQTHDSFLFFGDSTTWGSYLGRTETLPYRFGQATGRSSYNLGVPGFTAAHMVPFLKYALSGIDQPAVVIQLQYFWGDSKEFTGLPELLNSAIPEYSIGLEFLRQDMGRDDETMTPPYADYASQSAERVAASIERGKLLFVPKKNLDPDYLAELLELLEYIRTRPNQQFYLYLPPYQLAEINKYTGLRAEDFNAYGQQIKELFPDLSNVHFMDFNTANAVWEPTDFIDWIHLSRAGEEQFAQLMQQWLLSPNNNR